MLRYREENLGNLQNSQHSFGYSASDYQHSKSAASAPPLPKATPSQSIVDSRRKSAKSEFSITGDEHLFSKHSYYDLPASEASYDPFRASRSPIVNPKNDYVNVTVHRLGSKGSKKHGNNRNSRGNSLRVDVLRGHSRRGSRISSKHSSASNSARRGTTGKRSSRSSSSKLSVASSHLLSGSPLPVMRPSEVHRRGVQFSHLRKSSTASALHSVADTDLSNRTPDHRARALRKLAYEHSSSFLAASPPMPADPIVCSKKKAAILPTPRMRKLKDPAELEARKVSAELSKACDEAFWRSSVSSSVHTSSLHTSSAEKPYVDTPPSSISRPSPHAAARDPFFVSSSVRNRPLPPTPMVTRSTLRPMETPVTYTTRELAEMRDRLAVKYAREGAGNQMYFNDVLRQLDSLMKPTEERDAASDGLRIVSAPPDCLDLQGSVDLNGLDVIPEEGRFADADERDVRRQRGSGRGITASSGKRGQPSDGVLDTTIRVVAPSPPRHPTRNTNLTTTPWAPLNIRKSSTSTQSSSSTRSANMEQARGHSRSRGKFLLHEQQFLISYLLALCLPSRITTDLTNRI
jgi:serine/threonine-protein kinase HSL1 (negative regulator of Swe1 kinase)